MNKPTTTTDTTETKLDVFYLAKLSIPAFTDIEMAIEKLLWQDLRELNKRGRLSDGTKHLRDLIHRKINTLKELRAVNAQENPWVWERK